MAGLNLGVGGGLRGSASVGSQPATIAQAAWGPGYAAPTVPSATDALTPNDPFGFAFTAGVVAFALLLVIRHTLPK